MSYAGQTSYDIAEVFYSIKGEGIWTGHPMSFIRLAGCNLHCSFCDTDYSCKTRMSAEALANKVSRWPSRRVVITGGEPLMQRLEPLMAELFKRGFLIHLETNGTLPLPDTRFDWVAVSPKTLDFDVSTVSKANEAKVLYGTPNWETLAYRLSQYWFKQCILMMMPVTTSLVEGNKAIDENVQGAIQYCLNHPEWRLCPQVHKLMGFK